MSTVLQSCGKSRILAYIPHSRIFAKTSRISLMGPYMIGKLCAKYQLCAIRTADNTDGKSRKSIVSEKSPSFRPAPHKRLLSKLTSYGITGNTHNWITYFLSNRKQRVSVNGALSDITDVTSGVPQGSVLGPILLLYINDINENVQSSIRLFADDSIIYRKINSNIDHQILQTDLAELEKWSDKWQMQFNLSKCVHLPITNKTKPSSHQYSLFGHPLSKVASHSYLGVKLDSKLSWAKHITEITSKSSKVLGMVNLK